MKIIVALAAAAVGALLAAQSTAFAPQVRVLRNDADRLVVQNGQAEWSIAKRCSRSAGPGYIHLVRREGRVVVDDENEPVLDDPNGGRNPYGASGGLGSFAYQHARGIPPFEFGRRGGTNSWWVSGRVCAGSHPQAERWFGVSQRCCVMSPLEWDDSGTLRWSIDVDLRSPWQEPLLRVRYEYEFARDVVTVRTTVRSLCVEPTCGDAPYRHFAKEPKFTVQVVPAAGETITAFDNTGVEVERWLGGHPRKGTAQVADDSRAAVVFGASGLRVAAHSAAGRWEGSGAGLDEWAVMAAGTAPAPSADDGPAPVHWATGRDTRWHCNGGSPDGQEVRRWELVGGGPGFPAAVFFHGWEGGVGHNDCEPAARHFPPSSTEFVNEFEYSFPG
jgi:hypothetical protein